MSGFDGFPAAPEILLRTPGTWPIWTPERTARAVELWKGGMSATEIARSLSPPATRNAVIGKIHRMGLRRGPARERQMKAAKTEQIAAKIRRYNAKSRAPWYSEATELQPEVLGHPVLLVDLEDYHCRWPVGRDGITALFCGETAMKSYSYCARHCRMGYLPPEARRRRA